MEIGALARRSVEVILEGQAPSGGYVACPTFPPYRYSWFRDGSFIADAMSRVGEVESAEAFYRWCARVLLARAERIDAGEHPHTRYTLDGEEGREEWSNFQLDGFGLWLWSLRSHEARHGRSLAELRPAVDLTLRYLARAWREPCFDWWEEREGVHPATLACVWAGLAAWEHAEADAVLAEIALDGARLDASLVVLGTPFGLAPPPLEAIVGQLVSPGGGVHRHRDDTYYGGGEWLLLTALLGWHLLELGHVDEARARLEWVADRATSEGHLPEQSQEHLLAPESLEPWVRKWGPPPSPLLWSHAMFLTLATELDEV